MGARVIGENFFQIRCDELVFLAGCFGAAQYVCKKFTHTVLLIDKKKQRDPMQQIRYRVSQGCWSFCYKQVPGVLVWSLPENPISSYIFTVDNVWRSALKKLICKDGAGGRRKYKIFFVGGKEKKVQEELIYLA